MEVSPPNERRFTIEAVLAFPELDDPLADASVVPEFFSQMATDDGGRMKCRLRMEAVWTDDGSIDGAIEHTYRAVRTMGAFTDAECSDLKPKDRARIQLIYVPASRDGISQVTAFLRGRLWRAINWSEGTRTTFASAGSALNNAFSGEPAVDAVVAAVTKRCVGDSPQGRVDCGERCVPILDRQIGQVDIHRQPWEIADEKIDRRAALQGEAGFLEHEGEGSDEEADLPGVDVTDRHRATSAR